MTLLVSCVGMIGWFRTFTLTEFVEINVSLADSYRIGTSLCALQFIRLTTIIANKTPFGIEQIQWAAVSIAGPNMVEATKMSRVTFSTRTSDQAVGPQRALSCVTKVSP